MNDLTTPHPLAPFGWDDGFDAEFTPYAADGLVPGRIVRVDRGLCDVVMARADIAGDTDTGAGAGDGTSTGTGAAGTVTVRADAAPVWTSDPLRIVCTGDWAAIDPGRPGGPGAASQGGPGRPGTPAQSRTGGSRAGDPGRAVVRALLPRRTAFLRSTSSKRSEGQILAANVDQAVVAVSLAVELDLGRVERFLALAWESGARPLVALTKADLIPDPVGLAYLVADTEAAAPGVQVLAVSAATGQGMDVLAAVLDSGTTVLLGQSGAGKSTLANALVGTEVQVVRTTRDADGKGRHTTTTRDLLRLPDGGVLIDTPGVRGVGLWDADTGVARAFADVETLAEACRFHDCSHTVEPGCAVLGAIGDGELPERRLESYQRLQRENRHIAARTDARLRAEIRREWKQKGALGRQAVEFKNGRHSERGSHRP